MKNFKKKLISSILCASNGFTCFPKSSAMENENVEIPIGNEENENLDDNDIETGEQIDFTEKDGLTNEQIAGLVCAGILLPGGGAFGVKKIYDYCKNKSKAQKEDEKRNYPNYSSEYYKLTPSANFLKNTESISKFIKEELPKAHKILKNQNAITSLTSTNKTMFIGDVHGTAECLQKLIPKTERFLNEGDKKNCIVITGDFIDRHTSGQDDSIVSSLWFFYLLITYPDRVRILRGNHESVRYGLNGSLKSWWGPEFASCMEELPLVCLVNDDYIAFHGGLDTRLDLENTLEKPKLYSGGNEEIGTLPFHVMWNDFRDIGDSRRVNCKDFAKNSLKKLGRKKAVRGHDPFMNPVLDLGDGYYVFTNHSNSVVGSRACQKLNARILIVDHISNSIQFNYFLDNKVVNATDANDLK